jgi:molecular chaperone GrpE
MLKKKKTEDMDSTENITGEMDETSSGTQTGAVENGQSAEDKLKQELVDANDKYLRLFAEFDNFRRRTVREREEARKTEGKDVIVALIPLMDDFERAIRSMDNATDVTAVKAGVELIYNKLSNTLAQKGLKPMAALGETFDADLHEAITNIPAPTDDLKGKVVDEMEKGYYLGDKVVRFAKVIVGA